MTDRKGQLAAMKTVGPQHELFNCHRGRHGDSREDRRDSQTGRATQGVKMMTVADGDRVTAVARMESATEKAEASGEAEEKPEEASGDDGAAEEPAGI